MKTKFKKGDRVKVKEADQYQIDKYKYNIGSIGMVNEDSENPFILFDEEKSNYTSLGTAVHESELELHDETY